MRTARITDRDPQRPLLIRRRLPRHGPACGDRWVGREVSETRCNRLRRMDVMRLDPFCFSFFLPNRVLAIMGFCTLVLHRHLWTEIEIAFFCFWYFCFLCPATGFRVLSRFAIVLCVCGVYVLYMYVLYVLEKISLNGPRSKRKKKKKEKKRISYVPTSGFHFSALGRYAYPLVRFASWIQRRPHEPAKAPGGDYPGIKCLSWL